MYRSSPNSAIKGESVGPQPRSISYAPYGTIHTRHFNMYTRFVTLKEHGRSKSSTLFSCSACLMLGRSRRHCRYNCQSTKNMQNCCLQSRRGNLCRLAIIPSGSRIKYLLLRTPGWKGTRTLEGRITEPFTVCLVLGKSRPHSLSALSPLGFRMMQKPLLLFSKKALNESFSSSCTSTLGSRATLRADVQPAGPAPTTTTLTGMPRTPFRKKYFYFLKTSLLPCTATPSHSMSAAAA
jgi:hypothetical protein